MTMGCAEVQDRLSEWIDGLLDEPQSTAVRTHLKSCDDCRSEERSLAAVHRELVSGVAADRDRAGVVADRVLSQLPAATVEAVAYRTFASSTATVAPRSRWTSRTVIGYLLSAMAGFLIAAIVFRSPEPAGEDVAAVPSAQHPMDHQNEGVIDTAHWPAAHLVHATGNVSFRPPTDEVWRSVTPTSIAAFSCPSEGCVRTESGSLCELETSTGTVVRMNESSEIKMLADDELELVRGQVWCRASNDTPLKVVTTEGGHTEHQPAYQLMFTCPSNSESFASCAPAQPMQVVAAAGTVDVRMNGADRNLPPGTFCTITDGDVTIRQSSSDVLTAERWMQPLLTLSGHGNPELTRRVDSLLAQIGRTKLSHLYEQDLRSLGEYGALPLLKFINSEESAGEPSRRRFAMTIVADTSPVWMVPDLIELLEDDDPDVRFHAARGLARLTGETQGLSLDEWKVDAEPSVVGLASWRTWWEQHRSRFPLPPTSIWSITP